MNQEPIKGATSPTVKVTLPAKRRHIPNLLGCMFIGLIVLVLVSLMTPCFACVQVRGMQTKALEQARQVGLALKIFAVDHDGNFPRQGIPAEMTKAPANSNAAFATLFPTYTTSERIFGNKNSAYQTRQPDDVIDSAYTGNPVKTLEAGENVYAYVAGLTEKAPADTPIVLDGTDGTLYYNSTKTVRGGVWEGKRAVVIYLDNHGVVENLVGRENTRYVPVNFPGRPKNMLDLSWLGGDVHLLNPAVAP